MKLRIKALFTLLIIFISFTPPSFSNELKKDISDTVLQESTLNKTRLSILLISSSIAYGASIYALNELWYKDFPRSSFHFHDDLHHWKQMDKLGHITTNYWSGYYGMRLLKWSGVPRKKAIWYGGSAGMLVTLPIEIMDGFSEQWGFSVSDLGANILGTALFISQELLWEEQRIQLKYSFRKSGLAHYRPELLGKNTAEQLIKDYNAQTYWLSFSPVYIAGKEKGRFPEWLNLAVGYSSYGMLGAVGNPENLPEHERYRQWFISPDINFLKIETGDPWFNSGLRLLAFLKVPAPALEFNRVDGFKMSWF